LSIMQLAERARKRTKSGKKGAAKNASEEGTNDNDSPVIKQEATSPTKKETAKPKAKGKGKSKGRTDIDGEDSDDEEEMPKLHDRSDDEYDDAPKKKKRRISKAKKSSVIKAPIGTMLPPLDSATSPTSEPNKPIDNTEDDADTAIKLEDEDAVDGPSRRTRGIKRDYSMMADPSSDEMEPLENPVEEEAVAQVDDAMQYAAIAEEDNEIAQQEEQENDDQEVHSETETEIVEPDEDSPLHSGYVGPLGSNATAVTPYGELMGDPQIMVRFLKLTCAAFG
jgi:hypothetical protein